jgi:hypothetical protein
LLLFVLENLMKTAIRMSVVALAALGAVGAFAQVGDRWEPATPVTTNLSRAEVQSQAAQAVKEQIARGFINESGNYVTPAADAGVKSREDVRAGRGDLVNDPLYTRA